MGGTGSDESVHTINQLLTGGYLGIWESGWGSTGILCPERLVSLVLQSGSLGADILVSRRRLQAPALTV